MNKPYTIIVKNLDGWFSAYCKELCVSGFGASEQESIDAVVRSIRSTLAAQVTSLTNDHGNIEQMAQFEHAAS